MMNKTSLLIDKFKSLNELVYSAIKEKIHSGDYKAGEWLKQESLSKEFGVSYTPIREALQQLIADGLVEVVAHKGARVTSLDEQRLAEVYCLRLLLEPIIVRLAVQNITKQQLEDLWNLIDQAKKLSTIEDIPTRRKINKEFHFKIAQTCGFPLLNRIYESVWGQFPDWMFYEGGSRNIKTQGLRMIREIKEHTELLKAFSSGNFDLAKELAIKHIESFIKDDLIEVFGRSIKILEEKQRLMGI